MEKMYFIRIYLYSKYTSVDTIGHTWTRTNFWSLNKLTSNLEMNVAREEARGHQSISCSEPCWAMSLKQQIRGREDKREAKERQRKN